jgi:hypothetical protein
MEPFIRKAIQNLVRIYEPQYLQISLQDGEQQGNLREFSVAWYGLPSIKKLTFFDIDYVKYVWNIIQN